MMPMGMPFAKTMMLSYIDPGKSHVEVGFYPVIPRDRSPTGKSNTDFFKMLSTSEICEAKSSSTLLILSMGCRALLTGCLLGKVGTGFSIRPCTSACSSYSLLPLKMSRWSMMRMSRPLFYGWTQLVCHWHHFRSHEISAFLLHHFCSIIIKMLRYCWEVLGCLVYDLKFLLSSRISKWGML